MKRLFRMFCPDFRPNALQQLELILQQFPEIARIPGASFQFCRRSVPHRETAEYL